LESGPKLFRVLKR